uniref:MBD domain-containing protein n=1 Tax=Opuntia streptacantha TaxID=393608 RepID=A0A7C9DKR9_OPUST
MTKKQKIHDDSKQRRGSIDLYAAQCSKCQKWRLVNTKEEYEDLRSRFSEDPFSCTRIWVIDKPNLPKSPEGFKRELILRSDYSKLDAHYVTPNGKKVRCLSEVIAFLEKHPEYRHISVDEFNFTVPKILEDTIPGDAKRMLAEKSSSKKDNSAFSAGSVRRKRIARKW